MKKNCWEFNNCGREHNCPSASERKLDGIHGGKNSGRTCWVVAGTLCKDKPHGPFIDKFKDCASCSFHKKVRLEEGSEFSFSLDLLKRLKGGILEEYPYY